MAAGCGGEGGGRGRVGGAGSKGLTSTKKKGDLEKKKKSAQK